jgi:hypothetical protein
MTLKIVALITLLSLAVGGFYLFTVFEHRQSSDVTVQNNAGQTLHKDDLAVLRAFFPAHFEDTQRLEGTSVWMRNGYTMPYYSYANGKVDFSKPVGMIPAAQRLDVKKIVKAAVPASEDDGLAHGSQQAFAEFSLPGGTALFATPIGMMQGDQEAYYTDVLFYYDDPHTIYDYWPKDVWTAIDAHQVKQGMSELETRMAIGQKIHAVGKTEGNRTVTYNQDGKKWTVTFVKNRATAVSTTVEMAEAKGK